jgi:hypothetical protein
MSNTVFVNYQTIIEAPWLNDVNNLVYSGVFQTPSVPVTPAWGAGTPNTGKFTTLTLVTPLSSANGGTDNSSAPANGQLLIGNGTNFVLNTLTAGSHIAIDNTIAGEIIINATTAGASQNASLVVTMDNGSNPIPAGNKCYITVPYNCSITGWTLYAEQVGNITCNVNSSSFLTFPALSSVDNGTPPALVGSQKNELYPPVGWATALTEGEVLVITVPSPATVTTATLTISILQG